MARNYEEDSLLKIGSDPIAKPKKELLGRRKWTPGEMQRIVYLRRRQTFFYHVCDCVAQDGWRSVQELLNETQLNLEELYGTSSVEAVNIYRKNNTKDDGICVIMIFKIGPIEKPIIAGVNIEVTWWERARNMLRAGFPSESSL